MPFEPNLEGLQGAFEYIIRQSEDPVLTPEPPHNQLRPGIIETPKRAAKAWVEKTAGYGQSVETHFKAFETESETVRGMVLLKHIELESMCEHHLERIWGYAHIGYIPKGKVLGLSKFTRIVDVLARRLTVQERLTATIADAIMSHLQPEGVGVVIEARHACMETRGIRKRGQTTTTSELRGAFFDDAMTRGEFLSLARTNEPF